MIRVCSLSRLNETVDACRARHVVTLVRDRAAALKPGLEAIRAASTRTLARAGTGFGLMLLPGVLLWAVYPGDALRDEFPADYSWKYGPRRPFAPSLAMTATGHAYDSRTLAGSESCGTAGCHEQIAAEWRVSAHRWSAMDLGFQRIQEEMAKQNGPESTRYCGGCHDPIALFSGAKNIYGPEDDLTSPGADEGVSCVSCHRVVKTDVQGNANYVLSPPRPYLRTDSITAGMSRFSMSAKSCGSAKRMCRARSPPRMGWKSAGNSSQMRCHFDSKSDLSGSC